MGVRFVDISEFVHDMKSHLAHSHKPEHHAARIYVHLARIRQEKKRKNAAGYRQWHCSTALLTPHPIFLSLYPTLPYSNSLLYPTLTGGSDYALNPEP